MCNYKSENIGTSLMGKNCTINIASRNKFQSQLKEQLSYLHFDICFPPHSAPIPEK